MFEDWAALAALPAMGLGFASLYLWFVMRPTFSDDDLEAVRGPWRRAALKLGGALSWPTKGRSGQSFPIITATVGGAPVTVETRAWREWAYTRNALEYVNRFQTIIAAPSDDHPDLHLALVVDERPEARGDDFSGRFRVKGNNADLAPSWLGQDFRDGALATTGYLFAIEGGRVLAISEQLETDPAQLEAAVRAVGALASRSRSLLTLWREAAEELGGTVWTRAERWEPEGRTMLIARRGGCQVKVDTRLHSIAGHEFPYQATTRIRAEVSDARPLIFALHGHRVPGFARYFPRIDDFDQALSTRYILRSPRKAAASCFPPELSRAIARLAPLEITRDDRWVTLQLKGVVDCPGRLERAVDAAVQLARPEGEGPYR